MSESEPQESVEEFRARPARGSPTTCRSATPTRSRRCRRGGTRGGGRFGGERSLQRKAFDAGLRGHHAARGVRRPGLTPAHERAFREEAAGYVSRSRGRTFRAPERCSRTRHPTSCVATSRRCSRVRTVWVQFFSEPGAGSDLAGVRTRADRDGDRWILNGAKIWSTGAADRRLRDVPRPHRLGRAEAPGPHVVRGALRRSRRHRAADPRDQWWRRLLSGVLRRRRAQRRRRHRRGQQRMGRHPDDADLRARRGTGQ